MWYLVALLAGVAADQALKLWVVEHLELSASMPLIPGLVELRYVQNTGGGFSILTGHTWLLTVLTAVVMAVIVVLLVRRVFSHPFAMWMLTLILSGGLGNLVDRLRLGFVVDMFNLLFMDYPVFNIADILVVCGTIGFAVYYLLLHDRWEKRKKEVGNGRENCSGDDC